MFMRFDFATDAGQQEFQKWVTSIIRNEINSVVRQVLFERDAVSITIPTVGSAKPGGGTYSADDVQSLRLDRLEQAIFRR